MAASEFAHIGKRDWKMRYAVYVVDDHPIFVEGLRGILERTADFEVAGWAADADAAREQIPALRPDLVTLDLALPDGSGFDLIQFMGSVLPKQRILVLSGLDKSLYAFRALRAGAHGFLSKQMASTNLVEAMRTVAEGEVYLDKEMQQRLLAEKVGHQEITGSNLDELTNRELDVYRLIGAGLTMREIAERLHLSPKTVETYRANIKRKLGVPSSRALVRDATVWCLVGSQPGEARPKNAA